MKKVLSIWRLSSLLLANLLIVTPIIAQQKQPTVTKAEEITFETLLAARSYKLYGEVRMIGQLVRSNAVMEMLEPARLLGSLPSEVKGALALLTANADALAASRLMFASTPVRAGLPQTFVAIELASPEDAIKLEPKLRSFFSSLKTQAPAAAPAQSGASTKTKANKSGPVSKQQNGTAINYTSTAKPFILQRAGSLILMSDTAFTLKNLRPEGSQPLSSDQNLQRARSRFASESLFVYYDVKLSLPNTTEPRLTAGRPPAVSEFEVKRGVPDGAVVAKDDETPPPARAPSTESISSTPTLDADPILIAPEAVPPPEVEPTTPAATAPQEPTPEERHRRAQTAIVFQMFGALFGGGNTSLPEAVGLAAALEGGDVVVRALMINAPGTPNAVIPFFPAIISGPEVSPRAQTLSPADTAMFVSLSLDLPRTYDAWLKGIRETQKMFKDGSQPENEPTAVELQMAIFEQALGFKIKEDLLGALGNEVSIDLPSSLFKFSPNSGLQTSGEPSAKSAQTGLTVFISLNNKERVREMLPRVMEAFGLLAPGASSQTEKRGDLEIINYGTLSLAFIDDFLVVSPEASALRSVIDARENGQTLASNPDFRNSTTWQSNRVLGQLYLAPEMTASNQPFVQLDDQLQELFSRFNLKPSAITHAVLSDNAGIFHELHLPKDWLAIIVGGLNADRKATPIMNNELHAVGALMSIRAAQTTYKAGKGKGSYATREQLLSERLVPNRMLEMEGYRIEITTTSDKFEVTATPTEYGKTGRQSFYMDESGVIRGADHAGQPATVSDKAL